MAVASHSVYVCICVYALKRQSVSDFSLVKKSLVQAEKGTKRKKLMKILARCART